MPSQSIDAYDVEDLIAFNFESSAALDDFLDILISEHPHVDYALPPGTHSVILPKVEQGALRVKADTHRLNVTVAKVVSAADVSPEEMAELRSMRRGERISQDEKKRIIKDLRQKVIHS